MHLSAFLQFEHALLQRASIFLDELSSAFTYYADIMPA